jgi:hypothetical protein
MQWTIGRAYLVETPDHIPVATQHATTGGHNGDRRTVTRKWSRRDRWGWSWELSRAASGHLGVCLQRRQGVSNKIINVLAGGPELYTRHTWHTHTLLQLLPNDCPFRHVAQPLSSIPPHLPPH